MHKLTDTSFRSLLNKGQDVATAALLLTLIHPRAWKANSWKSTFTDLSQSSPIEPGILHKHRRFLLGLEEHPRTPNALGSGVLDATQRSARPRRPASLLLPVIFS